MACIILIREKGEDLFRVEVDSFDDPFDALPIAAEIAQRFVAARNAKRYRRDHIKWTELERVVFGRLGTIAHEEGPVPE